MKDNDKVGGEDEEDTDDVKKGSETTSSMSTGRRRKPWRYGFGRIKGSWAWRVWTTRFGGMEGGSGKERVRENDAGIVVIVLLVKPISFCRSCLY